VGNFSYKLYRLFLSLHSFSVTLFTLGSRLFFILLQINKIVGGSPPPKGNKSGGGPLPREINA